MIALVGALVTTGFGGRVRRAGALAAVAATLGLFACGLSPMANWLTLPLEERFPAFTDDGTPVAGIIVLGGAVQSEETFARGQLILNDAGERMLALGELARRYPAAQVVFTGGAATLIADGQPEAQALVRFGLPAVGVSAERLTIEDRSRTTRENAVFSRDLVHPGSGERWLLVTSAWHMPRAVGCFRQAGFPVVAYPVDFRTGSRSDRWRPFTSVSDGLRRFDLVMKEWIGLVGYRLAGYTDALFPAP